MQAPDWIDQDAWEAFTEMRKAKGKRAPFTDRAAERIVQELQKLELRGHPHSEVLWQSVMNGWSGVFPIKGRQTGETDWQRSQRERVEEMTGGLVSRQNGHHYALRKIS